MARRSAVGVFNGNWKNRWRREWEEIQASEDRRVFIVENNKEKFAEALDVLKHADPDGWEKWFDDDANIPEYLEWTNSALISDLCSRMTEQAKLVQQLSTMDG
jgi:hypothetical protein